MSAIENDSGDIIYFILCFLLTFALVFILIFFLFLCFSGQICVMIYYLLHRAQVIRGALPGPSSLPPQAVDPESAPLIVETEYFPRPSGYDGYCMVGEESALQGPHHNLNTNTINISGSTARPGRLNIS